METYKTTRIWAYTLSKLRLIAALTNTSIVKTIDRLADEEVKRLKATLSAKGDVTRQRVQVLPFVESDER
jgi:hypothetical protein